MIWGAILKKGKFPLHLIDPGVKVDAQYYSENVFKPFGDRLYQNGYWVYQKDSAPAHKAIKRKLGFAAIYQT